MTSPALSRVFLFAGAGNRCKFCMFEVFTHSTRSIGLLLMDARPSAKGSETGAENGALGLKQVEQAQKHVHKHVQDRP